MNLTESLVYETLCNSTTSYFFLWKNYKGVELQTGDREIRSQVVSDLLDRVELTKVRNSPECWCLCQMFWESWVWLAGGKKDKKKEDVHTHKERGHLIPNRNDINCVILAGISAWFYLFLFSILFFSFTSLPLLILWASCALCCLCFSLLLLLCYLLSAFSSFFHSLFLTPPFSPVLPYLFIFQENRQAEVIKLIEMSDTLPQ